ncbi:MAG: hypothetical protein HUU35_09655, partial [Armatimonadetes bacterium]|nr:hypothetical protein [Armatimonadota bacterium]
MFLLALLLTVVPVVAQSDVGRELVVNGDFETDANRDGWPDGYSGDRRVVKWLAEEGNHFIRMGGPTAVNASVGQIPSIQPDWFQLRVSIKVRAAEVARGPESWHDARVAMAFFDAAKKQVGGWPSVMYWTGSTDGWQRFEKLFPIPPGATTLNITPALFNATGQVDYDDFSVVVTKLRPKLEDAVLPAGVVADWSLANAWRQETATRGKVCLNGLWKFLPLMQPSPTPARPADGQGWGYLKVPAVWPGRNVEAVKPIGPDIWEQNLDWAKVTEGWYERDVTVPAEWTGRRLFVSFDLPQTEATVYVGGQRLGAVRFPGGRLDLTDALRPGTTTRLAVHVTTDPLEKERMVAMREDLIERVKAEVRFRGLVGDVFLESEPTGPRLGAVQARPSVRQKALGLAVEAVDLAAGRRYHLEAVARRGGGEEWRARSQPFGPGDLRDGRAVVSLPWANPRLWDFGQPNLYDLEVTLLEDGGKPLDTAATRFGFRELWLDGRNLMLNGSPVHLRAVNFSGGTSSDSALSATALRTTFSRLRAMGFNFIILSNYGLDPGQTTSFSELLEVADQEGFALAFSLPHALRAVGGGSSTDELYDRVARYAVDAAGNHPAVLAYAANHNSLGYYGDQNPAKMDGIHQHNPAGSRGDGFRRNRETAARREAFVRSLDPTRELYHHQSGHMGSWHTVNIYLNWSPIQERSEWLSHWADKGVKPLFFVEWGPPHQASWGGHRQGPFIWRNLVNSEPLGIEYGALVTGDRAYAPNPVMERYVDQYEQVYARRQPFHIHNVLGTLWASSNEHNNIELKTVYTDVVWPRLRTYGITAILPWDYGDVAWRKGQAPAELPQATDWSKLQRPGRAPDFLRTGGDYWTSAWPDWELTSWGRSFLRWNMPEAAYLAGAPERFTERGHNVAAGERLTKQAILINDTRESLTRPFTWRLTLGRGPVQEGRGTLSAPPGGVARAPISFTIPPEATGELTLSLRVGSGDAQLDSMTLHVTPPARPTPGKLAVFDPVGLTTRELAAARVTAQAVTAEASLDGFDALVIGREAIRLDNRLPDLAPLLGRGGRVLVMEQREEVLTQRLGFRTNDPSLRNVVVRVPEHPVLTDLDAARLADWRGESTLLPAAMELPEAELSDPPK